MATVTAEVNGLAQRLEGELAVTDATVAEQLEEDKYAAYARKVTTDVRNVQIEKLKEILRHNAGCQYLSSLGVDGDTDVESFKRKVPVSCYEDMQENINRMANGEITNFYSVDPVIVFIQSSGTSGGKAKLLPITARRADNYPFLTQLAASTFQKSFPGIEKGKNLTFAFVGQQIRTPSGLIAGHGSTNFFKSDAFRKRPFDPNNVLASPDAAILCEDYHQAMYCHLLCGLYQAAEVTRLTAIFASTIVAALRILQSRWKEICEDIRTGTVSSRITDPELRQAVSELLHQPRPDLALAVEKECGKGSWEGIVPRLWPNVVLMSAVTTGSMLQYVPALQFFGGNVPCAPPGYASAESMVLGLNLSPVCSAQETRYVLWPDCQYFELLPLKNGDAANADAETVELADAVVGEEYEPVLTTNHGLYRYRLGDVVKVAGFYNATPEVRFVRRKNVLLSIHNDKTDESDLQAAVSKAAELLLPHKVDIVDFSSFADVASHPGHYVLFLELTDGGEALDPSLLQECASLLDKSLLNEIYIDNRRLGIIGPLELRVVKQGTFERLMFLAMSRGAAPQQYKTPRCIQYAEGVQVLDRGVTHKFLSLAQF